MSSHDSDKVARLHRELHSHLPAEPALRLKALETVLVERGFLSQDAVDSWLDAYSENVGPMNGARVIARAWTDPDFVARLAEDTPAAFAALLPHVEKGYPIKAVFNTPTTHNLVVCTLCSCYPLGILGMSPAWYKSTAYRARAVRDPRGVLAEFGTHLPEGVDVRVWDSTSDRRYMVVPERPAGTGDWSETELAGLVTRNAMIGTVRDLTPARGAA
ncbi:nitrile hydratase subunit alpha [Pseudoponticoccus marisrubri]|uniref:nitrile hydratase n=1 Tax=Pseudoponticoccus marisrubri TaxID=1685382 RepID=A0A0W7WKH1_9RHOB|nr:nitrile hydratase subunit alpha [Pseudoponticoccus marisrubri]KUF11050.1 nitrile hydratase subunit alpha [Pseudoponticoccus marisrubri]